MKLKVTLIIVGCLQVALGLGYLFCPQLFLHAMGHSAPMADIQYPLGMLAARFIVFGGVCFVIAKSAYEHRLWIYSMIAIQLIDFAVGIFYTSISIVPLSLSGFPMFNAILIASLLWIWRPKFGKL
jgi:uncharacterized membrane protein